MAVIISNGATSLATASGFRVVEAHNLSAFSSTGLSCSSARYINVTFAHAGNCQGVVLCVYSTSMADRKLVVSLQDGTSDVAIVTLNTTDITGTVTSGPYAGYGMFIVSVIFASPVAITTDASRWRFKIVHGTGTGTWSLRTSDGTNPFFATWCDNAATFADNDVIICKDKVTIDKTATLGGVLGTGDTANGLACVICSNSAHPELDNVALLEWQNPPVSSYTLTIGGIVLMARYSGWRVGTAAARIPLAQQAIITWAAAAVGTTKPCIWVPGGSSSYEYGSQLSLFFYGQIPTYAKTTLTANAVVGATSLSVADAVDWVNGDVIVIGKQNTQGQGSTATLTVSSVVGTTINCSAVATNDRIAGGTVLKLGGYGIKMQNTASYSQHQPYFPANFVMSGVECYNQSISPTAGSPYYYAGAIDPTYRTQWLVQDVLCWVNGTSQYYFLQVAIPAANMLIQRVYGHRQVILHSTYSYFGNGYASGRLTVRDCVTLHQYSGTLVNAGTNNNRYTIRDCVFENARNGYPFVTLAGINVECYNNTFWGNGSTLANDGALRVGQCISPLQISENTYDNNALGVSFGAYTSVDCIDIDSEFGQSVANTADVGYRASGFHDYVFRSPSGSLVFDETELLDTVLGNRVSIVDLDDASHEDQTIYTRGRIQRVGDGLTDTTVRTSGSGKYAMRFEPKDGGAGTSLFEWSQDIPTGDIQSKTMTISCWIKINSATYYAGTHTNPTLTVSYDAGAGSSSFVAADSTDWQLAYVVFTPSTGTGKVTLTMGGATDAAGSDAYFYVDDFNVAYPAGVAVDLGGVDLWDDGLPVTPTIATVPALGGVWDEPKTAHAISGSFGELLDSAISTRLASASYTIPPTAAAIRAEIDANSTKLDATVTSRLSSSDYTEPPAAADIAKAVHERVCESDGNYSLEQIQRIVLSAVAGVTTTGGVFKTPSGGSTRITATIDSNAKTRTAIALTP